ncbi:MAG: ComF family protein [Rhizobiaceae bacterium]
MMRFLQKIRSNALLDSLISVPRDIVVPPSCLICSVQTSEQGTLCPKCWGAMHFIEQPYCQILGRPFGHDHGEGTVSPEAISDPPPFDRLRSVAVYNDLARSLVSGLKFGDRLELAPWMARWMSVAGRELISECDLIVPVPLFWRRLVARRFNQSAELARSISKLTGLKYVPLVLERRKKTRQQVGLSASERARNVQGAFSVPVQARPLVEGRRILLVDDVYTSGATAKACARAFRRAGVAGIDVLTFASVTGDYI